jgi:hypothetical protein
MKGNLVLVALIIVSLTLILINKKEPFDSIYAKPPEWFIKKAYNKDDWLVTYYPDQLSKPECVDYRGDNKTLNYESSAYRYWRF